MTLVNQPGFFWTETPLPDHLELDSTKQFQKKTPQKALANVDGSIIVSSGTAPSKEAVLKQIENSKPEQSCRLSRKSRCFAKQLTHKTKQRQIHFIEQPTLWISHSIPQSPLNKNFSKEDISKAAHLSVSNAKPIPSSKANSKKADQNQKTRKMIVNKNFSSFNFEEFLENPKLSSSYRQASKGFNKSDSNFGSLLKWQNDTKVESESSEIRNDQTTRAEVRNEYIDQLGYKLDLSIVHCERVRKNKRTARKYTAFSHKRSKTTVSSNIAAETAEQNHQENKKLKDFLKRALSTVSLNPSTSESRSESVNTKQANKQSKRHFRSNSQNVSQSRNVDIDQTHFSKLKERVESKMQEYKKINQIREAERKQKRATRGLRFYEKRQRQQKSVSSSAVPTNQTEFKVLSSGPSTERFDHKRPFTAVSRTGLEYQRKEAHRRRSSEGQNRSVALTGVKSKAKQTMIYATHAHLETIDIEECKSDRVIKNLRKTYGGEKSDSKKLRSSSTKPHSRPLSGRESAVPSSRPLSARIDETTESFRALRGGQVLEYHRVSSKEIGKQQMKEKVLQLIVDCEEEKVHNAKIKKGIDIFQDYCDNIEDGLKQITSTIDKYILDID